MPWQVNADKSVLTAVEQDKSSQKKKALQEVVKIAEEIDDIRESAKFGFVLNGVPAFFVHRYVLRCRLDEEQHICTVLSISV